MIRTMLEKKKLRKRPCDQMKKLLDIEERERKEGEGRKKNKEEKEKKVRKYFDRRGEVV